MPSRSQPVTDEYPSLLWITIPPAVLLAGYFLRKWYLAYKLRTKGIGKGAPGFQTSVRQVRITPEIRTRLERGENVSPEEIAKASAAAATATTTESSPAPTQSNIRFRDIVEVNESQGTSNYGSLKGNTSTGGSGSGGISSKNGNVDNEWLPESISQTKKKGKGKRK